MHALISGLKCSLPIPYQDSEHCYLLPQHSLSTPLYINRVHRYLPCFWCLGNDVVTTSGLVDDQLWSIVFSFNATSHNYYKIE